MLLRTFRCWSSFIAHLALLLVLNLLFDGPALAEQARLRSRLVELPAELEARSPWPDEATVEEALRLLTPVPSPIPSLPPGEGRPLPPSITKGATTAPQGVTASSERAIEKSPPLEVETLGGGAPLPGEGSAMGEGTGVRGPVLLASAVPPPPSLPDMPAASTVTEAPQPMAAPASAPSPDAVSLLSGWNLISLPRQPDSVDPSAVLASISGSYQVVHAYDACSSDPWRTWNPADPAGSSLTAIDHRIGLWVRATAAATLAVSGTEPAETTIQLCQGWNLIGYPLSQPRPVLGALSSIAGRFQRVYGWDPADPADPWEVFDVAVPAWANDLEQMLPGRGYWIYATADTTLVMSNTGLPPEVAITSPANAAAVTAPTEIKGTVRSNLLERWMLAYRLKGETASTTFATGSTPITNGVLGKLDPSLLLNGLYEIELTATDFQGQSVSASIDVVVEGNLKIGHFTLSFVDMEVPLAGLPIQVIRTYDSRDKRVGDFGVGWTLSLSNVRLQEDGPVGDNWRGVRSRGLLPNYCIQPIRERVVTVTLPDDQVLRFRPKISPECQQLVPPQVVTLTYVPLPGTRASLTALDQSGEMLVVGSFPGSVQLWNLESIFIADPDRYRVTMQDGRALEVNQQGGLVSITDLNGNALMVGRNGITHSSGSGVTFGRDAQGKITRITDPAGESLTYAYNTSVDLVAVTDREEATTRFTYDDHYLLSIQDPLGRQPIRNEYDASGRLTSTTDAFGKTIKLTHSLATNQEVVTDRLGHSRVLEYDGRGNVIRETDALGNVTIRTFDARDNLLTETNPLGETTSYTYDASGNVASIADSLGHVTRYTYDSRGQVLTVIDPLGKVTTNTYNAKGNLLTTTDAAGGVTTYTYDANGNPISVTDPSGARTLHSYDSAGNVIQATDALDHVTTYTYDQRGNRLTETTQRATAGGIETLVTTRTYDREGQELSVTDAAGGVSSTSYDSLGQVTSRTDALGRTTRFAYDSAGRPSITTYPDGTTETRSYDAEGRLISQTDRAGRITTYTYDAAGRQLSTTFPGGASTRNSYDAAGRVVATTDARGNVTRYEYDAASRRIKVIDPLGRGTRFFYDAAGNQIAFLDARGHTTQFEFDALGKLARTVYPGGTETRQACDAVGRRISAIDQAGIETKFDYDSNGRLVSVTDALQQVTAYIYDEVGNRISQTDAKGRTTRFGFDKLGRQTRRELPDGSVETWTYDAVGNLLAHTDFSGVTKTYTYDSLNRLLSKSSPGGSMVTFTYHSTGQRATQTDARGTTTYQYDAQDRLERLVYPDGRTLTYRYDDQGNRTELTAHLAGGVTLSSLFSYDALNRLATVTDPLGRVYTHDYDEVGNRAGVSYPNGITTRYAYNALNRLTQLTSYAADGGAMASYAYTLGPSGNRTRIDEAGDVARFYTYDALYRLVGEEVRADIGLIFRNGFTYDPVGNRLTQAKTGSTGSTATLTYDYDNRDRLLTETGTSYTWDTNGNLRSKSGEDGGTYVWDSDNRLIELSLANGDVVEHVYDADGNRVRTKITPATGPPVVTDYLVDPSVYLSQVIAETDAAGAWEQYFIRGDDLLALLRPTQTRFYHSDGLGSIRVLTDETGTVTDTYTFSAFGELLNHTGTDPNAYLFAGEQLDPNSGFYYLRARWMNPRTGQFGSMDPEIGVLADPASLHRYLYASADPVNRTDPSGRMSLLSLSITAAIISGLAAAFITYLRGGSPGQIVLNGIGVATATFLAVYYGIPLIERFWHLIFGASVATGMIQGQYGSMARAAFERAAASGGPSTLVITAQTQAPLLGRGLSVATGPQALSLAQQYLVAGRQLYAAQIPNQLLRLMEQIGIAVRLLHPSGVQEIRFAPQASEFIVRYFSLYSPP